MLWKILFSFLQTSEAISIGENMKNFLSRFCSDENGTENGKAFSPIETYQLVDAENLDSFLDSLRTNSMISKVSALYEEKDYDTVQVTEKSNYRWTTVVVALSSISTYTVHSFILRFYIWTNLKLNCSIHSQPEKETKKRDRHTHKERGPFYFKQHQMISGRPKLLFLNVFLFNKIRNKLVSFCFFILFVQYWGTILIYFWNL